MHGTILHFYSECNNSILFRLSLLLNLEHHFALLCTFVWWPHSVLLDQVILFGMKRIYRFVRLDFDIGMYSRV